MNQEAYIVIFCGNCDLVGVDNAMSFGRDFNPKKLVGCPRCKQSLVFLELDGSSKADKALRKRLMRLKKDDPDKGIEVVEKLIFERTSLWVICPECLLPVVYTTSYPKLIDGTALCPRCPRCYSICYFTEGRLRDHLGGMDLVEMGWGRDPVTEKEQKLVDDFRSMPWKKILEGPSRRN